MSYRKAEQVLPLEIIKLIQDYIDGKIFIFQGKKVIGKLGARKLQFAKS